MPFFLAINFLFSLRGNHSLSHSSQPFRLIIKSTITTFTSSSPPGGSSLSISTPASKAQPSNSNSFKPTWGSHESGTPVSDSESTSMPSNLAGQRQDGPGLQACGCFCTCFFTLHLFGGWPQNQHFGCMHNGGLCQCNGEMLGLMLCWHQIGLFFLFSFFTDLATFHYNKLPCVQWCCCPSLPKQLHQRGPSPLRGHASRVILFGLGPHGFMF